MIILAIPSGSNYSYILAADKRRKCAVIDPINTNQIIKNIKDFELGDVEVIFNTHNHGDHTGGNSSLQQKTNAKILAHKFDYKRVPGKADSVNDGDVVTINDMEITVLHTPGHTSGGICLFIQPDHGKSYLFSGDTVFVAGCGNPNYGGNPEKIYKSFKDKIFPLPTETVLCPGHDYSINDLNFALSIEPNNKDTRKFLRKSENFKNNDSVLLKDIFLTTLEEERLFSPFFRLNSEEIRNTLKNKFSKVFEDEKSVFLALRELRNRW
jgi:hydroxyacylglutathione hydrolase